jgi:hypothetical protein
MFKFEFMNWRGVVSIGMLTSLACGAAACGGGDVDSEPIEIGRQALNGGTPTTKRDEIGHFKVMKSLSPPATGGGTATLISDRHFLTAGHINDFAVYSAYTDATSDFYLTTGSSVDSPETNVAIKRIFGIGTALGDKDLAVGELAEPVPLEVAEPAELASFVPAASRSNPLVQTAFGYGCNSSNPSLLGKKQSLEFNWFPGYQPTWICSGDSGGPTVGGTKYDRGPIYGVASSDTAPFHANAVTYREHILSLIRATTSGTVCYRVSVQGPGLQPAFCDVETAGTVNENRALEGLQVWSATDPSVTFTYRVYVKGEGWSPQTGAGYFSGSINQGKVIEAVQIMPNKGLVEYRVRRQGIGWAAWTSQGLSAGVPGSNVPIEAIRIVYTP